MACRGNSIDDIPRTLMAPLIISSGPPCMSHTSSHAHYRPPKDRSVVEAPCSLAVTAAPVWGSCGRPVMRGLSRGGPHPVEGWGATVIGTDVQRQQRTWRRRLLPDFVALLREVIQTIVVLQVNYSRLINWHATGVVSKHQLHIHWELRQTPLTKFHWAVCPICLHRLWTPSPIHMPRCRRLPTSWTTLAWGPTCPMSYS